MSKPPSAKEASVRAQTAAASADEVLASYKQQADLATKLFQELRAAANEAETIAGEIDRAVARSLQPPSAAREALERLRSVSSIKAAKSASSEIVNHLNAADDAARRASRDESRLQMVPALLDGDKVSPEGNPYRSSRKRASKRAAKAKKAVLAVSAAFPDLESNVQKAVSQLSAAKSLEAATKAAVIAESAADSLGAFATLVRKAAKSIEETDHVKWPTTYIWVEASKWIAHLAKEARRNAELARLASRGTPKGVEWVKQADEARARAESLEKEAREEHDSAITTEALLKVVGFFDDHKSQIFDRLEECDQIAANVINGDMIFIAESLPIINGIIHVGSARKELKSATDWVERTWGAGEAHPRIVLSALLFKYVTGKGVKEFIDAPPPHEKEEIDRWKRKKEAWERIRNRVDRLL